VATRPMTYGQWPAGRRHWPGINGHLSPVACPVGKGTAKDFQRPIASQVHWPHWSSSARDKWPLGQWHALVGKGRSPVSCYLLHLFPPIYTCVCTCLGGDHFYQRFKIKNIYLIKID
jgi:hypothetical protein